MSSRHNPKNIRLEERRRQLRRICTRHFVREDAGHHGLLPMRGLWGTGEKRRA